jgi:hypothetical protein
VIALTHRIGILGIVVGMGATPARGADVEAAVVDAVLCDDAKVPRGITNTIVAEATSVLGEAGIVLRLEVRQARHCDVLTRTTSALLVKIELPRRWTGSAVPPAGVGQIQFMGGEPGRIITLSLWTASSLITRDPGVGALVRRVGPRLTQQWTGRMLGRALAHEIVHYLLRSPLHTPTGLMRATHSVEAFVGRDRSAFRLSPVECDALVSRVRAMRQTEPSEKLAATSR